MKSKIAPLFLAIAYVNAAFTSPVAAENCVAEAHVGRTWLGHQGNFINVQFHVYAEGCEQYSCRGYVHYVVHSHNTNGTDWSDRHVVSYTVRQGSRQADISEESAGSGAYPIARIDAVDIEEVNCSSP